MKLFTYLRLFLHLLGIFVCCCCCSFLSMIQTNRVFQNKNSTTVSPHQINNLMHQMRDSPQPLGGSVGSIPSTFIGGGRTSSSSGDLQTLQKALRAHGVHSTPASNLKFSESVRNAQHDGSPSIVSSRTKLVASRSYSHDLKSYTDSSSNLSINKSGTSSASSSSINLTMPDISPNSSQFFEVVTHH